MKHLEEHSEELEEEINWGEEEKNERMKKEKY